MKVQCPGYALFQYSQVWKILEREEGCVLKTEFTGKSIFYSDHDKLPEGYQAVVFSSKDFKKDYVEIDLFNPDYFKGE